MYNGLYDSVFHNIKMKKMAFRRKREVRGLKHQTKSMLSTTPTINEKALSNDRRSKNSNVMSNTNKSTQNGTIKVTAYVTNENTAPLKLKDSSSSMIITKKDLSTNLITSQGHTSIFNNELDKNDRAVQDMLAYKNHLRYESFDCHISSTNLLLSITSTQYDFSLRIQTLGCLMRREYFEEVVISESESTIRIKKYGFTINSPEYKVFISRQKGLFGLDNNGFARIHKNVRMERVETLAALIQASQIRMVILFDLNRNSMYNYVNEKLNEIESCLELDVVTESIILSFRGSKLFNFKLFLSIYLKIQHSYISKEFIDVFTNGDIQGIKPNEKNSLMLVKAKEHFKLFKRTGNIKSLRASIKILESKKSKIFKEGRVKISMCIGDYYTAMKFGKGSITEYIALAHINPMEAVKRLKGAISLNLDEFVDYKKDLNGLKQLDLSRKCKDSAELQYILLLVSILTKAGHSPIFVYKEALRKYSGSLAIHLDLIRFLKTKNKERAYNHTIWLHDILIGLKIDEDITNEILFEEYILTRLLGLDYMRLLYNIRKKRNIPLFIQEIAYFEHRSIDMLTCENSVSLFLFKDVMRRDCNRDKCCHFCKEKYAKFIEYVYKYPKNGDFIILHYFIFMDVRIKKVSDHLDPEEGFYWPRLKFVTEFVEKMSQGIELARLDFCEDFLAKKSLIREKFSQRLVAM